MSVCIEHHRQIHARGDERAFWAEYGVDPVSLSLGLWAASVCAGRVRIRDEAPGDDGALVRLCDPVREAA